VLGCGSSTGTPRPSCLIDPNSACAVCKDAAKGPLLSKNYRGNPSLLIRYAHPDGVHRNIQIDVGKTFQRAVTTFYPLYRVPTLDAILLTHGHADACFGLDDVRGLQTFSPTDVTKADKSVTVHLSANTMKTIRQVFSYLVDKQDGPVKRKVAALEWHVLKNFEPFDVEGLRVTPVPVLHGEDYEALGFLFGERALVAYISDVSRIPDETMALLRKRPIDILIIDSLFKERAYNVHFSLPQALECIRALRPRRTLLTGLSDEFDYERDNAELRELGEREGLRVELPFDGQRLFVDL